MKKWTLSMKVSAVAALAFLALIGSVFAGKLSEKYRAGRILKNLHIEEIESISVMDFGKEVVITKTEAERFIEYANRIRLHGMGQKMNGYGSRWMFKVRFKDQTILRFGLYVDSCFINNIDQGYQINQKLFDEIIQFYMELQARYLDKRTSFSYKKCRIHQLTNSP